MPAIGSFSIKNRELNEDEIDERVKHYGIQTDLPLLVQRYPASTAGKTWKLKRSMNLPDIKPG